MCEPLHGQGQDLRSRSILQKRETEFELEQENIWDVSALDRSHPKSSICLLLQMCIYNTWGCTNLQNVFNTWDAKEQTGTKS